MENNIETVLSNSPSGEPFSPLLGETIERLEEVLLASPQPPSSAPNMADDLAVAGGSSSAATPATATLPCRRKKLNGAARKRLRRLLAANIGVEEALELAVKPWNQIPITNAPPDPKPKLNKRGRSEEESPKEQPKKAPKLEATQGVRPSFAQVAETKRVGIRDASSMNDEQMNQVHRSIGKAIITSYRGGKGKGPNFTGFTHKPGWILVTCKNQNSLDWLEREIPKIKPWAGAKLSVIPESELPKPTVAVTFFPHSETESISDAIMLLGAQNEGLNTDLWKVLHSRKDANGYTVTLSLDDLSVEALKTMDFQANLCFKMVTFKVKSGSEIRPAPVVGPQSSTSSNQGSVPREPARTWGPSLQRQVAKVAWGPAWPGLRNDPSRQYGPRCRLLSIVVEEQEW